MKLPLVSRRKYEALKRFTEVAEIESLRDGFHLQRQRRLLRAISACETPGANATVRRMAKLAREGLGE